MFNVARASKKKKKNPPNWRSRSRDEMRRGARGLLKSRLSGPVWARAFAPWEAVTGLTSAASGKIRMRRERLPEAEKRLYYYIEEEKNNCFF